MIQPYDLPLEELKTYRPELTKQPDFDAFWEKTLKQLASVELKYKLTPYKYPAKGVKVFKLSYAGFNNANIDGWFAVPEAQGPHPGLVIYHGYNWACDGNLHETVNYALKGYAVLQMLCRGQQGESVDNVVSSTGGTTGWMTKGIQSPEEYYYRAVYMDAVRGLEVLASMPEVDKTRIGVTGESQGGALTVAAAALSDIPKVAVSVFPYLSHFNRAIDVTPTGPYNEFNEYFRRYSAPSIEENAKKTLTYFDIMNLAARVKCPTWMCVGLIDEITPPSTVFAAYNHLECPKEMTVYRYYGHENIPVSTAARLQTLMDYLQK